MRIVIVGGGQAAVSFAAEARRAAPSAGITMLSAEPVHPYQRPPLSKAYLAGTMPLDRLLLRGPEWFDEHEIAFEPGVEVDAIDREKMEVRAGNRAWSYDALFIATGSEPRRLPASVGGELENVFAMRTLADADALAPALRSARSMVVVGGGYIGLEAAAVARSFGVEVVLLEAAQRILGRVACEQTADYFRDLHRRNGVEVIESVALNRLEGEHHVEGARLDDDRSVTADVAVVGIGIQPRTAIAERADLDCDDGIVVDERCRTSDPCIYAAGDCVRFSFRGQRVRLESVPHAIHQAEVAARNVVGADETYEAKPWFWSDQYDVKLQIAGLNTGFDRTVVRPGRREGAQSVWYYGGDVLLAVDAMNDAPAYMVGRRAIEAGMSPAPEKIADPSVDLRSLV